MSEPWKADADAWREDGWIDPVDEEIAEMIRARVREMIGEEWTDALRNHLRWRGPIVYGANIYGDGDVVSLEVDGRSFLLVWVKGKPRIMAIGDAP